MILYDVDVYLHVRVITRAGCVFCDVIAWVLAQLRAVTSMDTTLRDCFGVRVPLEGGRVLG